MKNVLKIITDESRLNSRCSEIDVTSRQKEVTKIVNDLKDTIRANVDLMSLSAPQLGYDARIFCIRFSDGDIRAFINPMITKIQGKTLMIEKSLSSDKEYMIQRPERILVGYQTPTGKVETDLSLKFPVSALFEQMVDLIDGKLFYKYEVLGLEIDKDYYKAPKKEKEELHKWYFDVFVPQRVKELEELAKNDKDIKKTQDAIAYMTSVISGETEVVPMVNGELDFNDSSIKVIQSTEKFQKDYENKIKEKFGIK